jgi:hypothetical protein
MNKLDGVEKIVAAASFFDDLEKQSILEGVLATRHINNLLFIARKLIEDHVCEL